MFFVGYWPTGRLDFFQLLPVALFPSGTASTWCSPSFGTAFLPSGTASTWCSPSSFRYREILVRVTQTHCSMVHTAATMHAQRERRRAESADKLHLQRLHTTQSMAANTAVLHCRRCNVAHMRVEVVKLKIEVEHTGHVPLARAVGCNGLASTHQISPLRVRSSVDPERSASATSTCLARRLPLVAFTAAQPNAPMSKGPHPHTLQAHVCSKFRS